MQLLRVGARGRARAADRVGGDHDGSSGSQRRPAMAP